MKILHPGASFLEGRASNITSQFGEDGLVQAIHERIGTPNQWCFEVGAADGLFFSNTKRLRDAGWNVVLIEGEPRAYAELSKLANEKVRTIQENIGPDSLDRILAECGAPEDLDLGVIDIDGQDYWVLDGMKKFKPRLLMVEFHDSGNVFVPPLGGPGQASLATIFNLALSKGWMPLVRTDVNLLCVREELMGGLC